MDSRKFAIWTLTSFFSILFALAIFVIVIDPNNIYHKYWFDLKHVTLTRTYQNVGYAKNLDYNVAIVGTSMTEQFRCSEVDEILGVKSIKLCESGAYTKDLAAILGLVEKKKNVDQVIVGIDANMFRKENSEYRMDLPLYLYNDSVFDDYEYWWSSKTIKDIEKVLLKNYYNQLTDMNEMYIRDESNYGKDIALSSVKDMTIESVSTTWEKADKNITNLEKCICDNPDIEFCLFMPPYSILFWEGYYKAGCIDQELAMHKKIIERFMKYNNVKIYYFMIDTDIITDLENYLDAGHYNTKVCNQLIHYIKNEEFLLTKENHLDVLESMRKLAYTYDYEQLYEEN